MACCRPRVALPLLGAGVYVVREPLAAAWECEVTAAAARLYAGLWLRLVRSVKVRWEDIGWSELPLHSLLHCCST